MCVCAGVRLRRGTERAVINLLLLLLYNDIYAKWVNFGSRARASLGTDTAENNGFMYPCVCVCVGMRRGVFWDTVW